MLSLSEIFLKKVPNKNHSRTVGELPVNQTWHEIQGVWPCAKRHPFTKFLKGKKKKRVWLFLTLCNRQADKLQWKYNRLWQLLITEALSYLLLRDFHLLSSDLSKGAFLLVELIGLHEGTLYVGYLQEHGCVRRPPSPKKGCGQMLFFMLWSWFMSIMWC